jgi:hypothetical protein
MHITEKQYTTDHKTKHIQYTVIPVMPMVAQLIKIFPRILWNLWFITQFTRMSFNALLKHVSILIQLLKIHFNIILTYSHRPSEWTFFLSCLPIKNPFKITFTPMHATFLTHVATVL